MASETGEKGEKAITSLGDVKEDRKKMVMVAKVSEQEAKVMQLQNEMEELVAKLKDKDAAATVKHHIKLLHDYNEIKDIGMGLLGIIAEQRGVRVKDVMEDFGIDEKD